MSDCLFCKVRDGEIQGDIVYEDDDVLEYGEVIRDLVDMPMNMIEVEIEEEDF